MRLRHLLPESVERVMECGDSTLLVRLDQHDLVFVLAKDVDLVIQTFLNN